MASRVSGGLIALIAGLCVVMLAVGIGGGALLWAGDDSSDDASSQPAEVRPNVADDTDDTTDADGGIDDGGAQPNDRPVTIQLYVYVLSGRHTATITPLWDAWNNCVKDANSPGDVTAQFGPAYGQFLDLTVTATGGGLFEDCSYQESRMHWQIKFANGSTFTVESHTPVGGRAKAACGPNGSVYNCSGVDGYGADTIAVPI
jgi:hypothetical protein